ncbi:MAG: substrate-binding domain-containing protein [Acidobacteriota bacterium]|nr:substrate-binding domain-containing protein [Acidobacteriota bacterium]
MLGLSIAAIAQSPSSGADPGSIRIWGHGHKGQDYILTLLRAWQAGFGQLHPGTSFEDELDGNASAIGGLYTNTADLAVLDREASFIEVDAYQQGTGYDPFRIPVARGSVATPHHAPALMVYVNEANPLRHLSMQQLDGIFDADHRLSERRYKTWGDLGVTGDWAPKPIQLYTYNIQSAEVQFFERAAMKGSQKFSCCLTQFQAKPGATAEQQIATALAKDKYGLALSSWPAPKLKAIALSISESASAVLPAAETIAADTYPLVRTVYIYVNRKPKSPVPAKVAAFLEYIVSPEGQAIVVRTGGYLPLPPEVAAKSREVLQ